MWDIKEKDLDEFKITCRNRLSPEAVVGFMLGEIWLVRISKFTRGNNY